MNIQIKNTPDLVIPIPGTPLSSGYDVVSIVEPEIVGVKYKDDMILWNRIDYIQYRTGVFIAPQQNQYGQNFHTLVFPRSSLSKYNLALANSIALIDNDYRGEILLRFKYIWQPEDYTIAPAEDNNGYVVVGKINQDRIYKKGDKIAQLVAEVSNPIDWVVVADLNTTQRGEGGFGSTGTSTISIKEKQPEHSTKVNLLDQYKKLGGVTGNPTTNYETLIREREKLVG
jgi:dUTP pyrophosphatase